MSDKIDIVIIGFPKCGTTALCKKLQNDSRFNLGTKSNGSLEVDCVTNPEILTQQGFLKSGKINVHKFVTYVYDNKKLQTLRAWNENILTILCLRDPSKSLVSWHRMHRAIARGGGNKSHFAYLERDFYGQCSIGEYYFKFARNRLNYAKFIKGAFQYLKSENLLIFHQEFLARRMKDIPEIIHGIFLNGICPELIPSSLDEPRHVGYADSAMVEIPPEVLGELEKNNQDMLHLLRSANKSIKNYFC